MERVTTVPQLTAMGVIPLSDLVVPLGVRTNPRGEIMIDRDSRTNIPGIYAGGDVTDRSFKQAITGVSEGVIATYSAYQDLKNDVVLACDDEEAHRSFTNATSPTESRSTQRPSA